MNSRLIILSLCAATLVAVLSAVAITRQNAGKESSIGQRQFEVTGEVLSADPASRTVRIAHDEIPGYMPAMTMPFPVKTSSELTGVNPGDQVRFRLVVTQDDSWVKDIRKLASSRVPKGAASGEEAAPAADRLEIGEKVPEVVLLDQNGQAMHLDDFKGKVVLLTFIYTRCPIPNFCPLMSKNFAALEERLQKRFPGRFHLVSVSIDPAFDRPEILKAYAARYNADERNWTFATGTAEEIDAAAALFGLTHEPENGVIAHDLRTALIGPDGKLAHVWKSNAWTPFEVERRVHEVLDQTR